MQNRIKEKAKMFFNSKSFRKYESISKKVTEDANKIDNVIKPESGRVYIRGNKLQLEGTKFKYGARYNIYPNKEKNSLAIVIAKDGKYKVSRRKDGSKNEYKPLLDIKDDLVKDMFKGYELALTVYADCIIVKKTNNQIESKKSKDKETINVVSSKLAKIVNISSYKKRKEEVVDINVDQYQHRIFLNKASGSDTFEHAQMSMFDDMYQSTLAINNQASYPFSRKAKEIVLDKVFEPITLASFFCGMGGLDYAFKMYKHDNQKVFNEIFALDRSFYKESPKNKNLYGKENCSPLGDEHIKNFRRNIGNHIVDADFLTYPIEDIPDFTVGSFTIPCVELSSVSPSRNKFVLLPKFIDRFIEIIKSKKDKCKVFVLENSINMLNAGREFLDKIKKELPWFEVTEHGFDTADFGAGQHRERAIVIGSTIGKIEIPKPKIALVKTVRQCFEGLHDGIPNQLDYSQPGEDTVLRMSFVRQGHNWEDIPEEYRTKGKFANYFRRLSLDEVSISIPNIRKSLITHPTENRTISVRECLRLFGFPDSFTLEGSLQAMQQMVANSVPLELGTAIADAIGKAFVKYKTNNVVVG